MPNYSDFPEMEPWLPAGAPSSQYGQNGFVLLVPYFQEQIRLSKILESILSTLSSAKNGHEFGRQASYDHLNLELHRWQASLPESARWNKWEPPSTPLIPSVAALQLVLPEISFATFL